MQFDKNITINEDCRVEYILPAFYFTDDNKLNVMLIEVNTQYKGDDESKKNNNLLLDDPVLNSSIASYFKFPETNFLLRSFCYNLNSATNLIQLIASSCMPPKNINLLLDDLSRGKLREMVFSPNGIYFFLRHDHQLIIFTKENESNQWESLQEPLDIEFCKYSKESSIKFSANGNTLLLKSTPAKMYSLINEQWLEQKIKIPENFDYSSNNIKSFEINDDASYLVAYLVADNLEEKDIMIFKKNSQDNNYSFLENIKHEDTMNYLLQSISFSKNQKCIRVAYENQIISYKIS